MGADSQCFSIRLAASKVAQMTLRKFKKMGQKQMIGVRVGVVPDSRRALTFV